MSRIVIEPYDPAWPALYSEERERILSALDGLNADIEHVGSTSVPGLAAKPIVDIMVGLPANVPLNLCVAPVEAIGYVYVPRYEEMMPYRRFFYKKPPDFPHAYNLHIIIIGHEFWVRHLLFRDYLRAHPDTALEYETLKRELAPLFSNTNDYSEAKTDFIRSVEEKAIRVLQGTQKE